MLDTATKKRIDDCRDILVGKLPDPKAQIEQITIGLIYKFMDDMDKEAIELGGKAKFFADYKIPDPAFPNDRKKDTTIPFSQYAWDKLLHPTVTAADMLTLYTAAIAGMEQNPNIPPLFRNIFKNAYLPYRDPETLKLFLKTIGAFEYTHSEKLGDAFEYLLSVMGSQGVAGQFRTPRHIIDFLVAIVDPDKGDTIMDPACGTAGFLIAAFKHILLKHTKANTQGLNIYTYNQLEDKPFNNLGDKLTPDDRKKLVQNFVGYDISPDMVRLSLVNLYLHGFNTPNIHEYDTLSSEERWNESFDVVLANPPFMSPKGGIRPHKKFSISSNRSEVLFVDYIAEHLNTKGKAGIIVPEGIIFQSGTAYKDLRKMLVQNYLYAVVSLPAGVFNPYSGVKTSILLMDRAVAKKTEEILFIKIDNDGYNLGAQRTAVKGGQLETAIQLVHDFAAKGDCAESPIAHLVPKAEIGKSGDYNLSGERYKVNDRIYLSNIEFVELKEICDVRDGTHESPRYHNEGFPLITSKNIKDGYIDFNHVNLISKDDYEKINQRSKVDDGDIIMPMIGTIGNPIVVKKEREFAIKNVALLKFYKESRINRYYLKEILASDFFNEHYKNFSSGSTQKFISLNFIRSLQIPLPPLSIQEAIVAEIDAYQKIIDGAKAVVANYKPQIDIDPAWEMVELGEVCDKIQIGPFGTQLHKNDYTLSGIPIINPKHIKDQKIFPEEKISIEKANSLPQYFLEQGDIIMGRRGEMGRVAYIGKNEKGWFCGTGSLIVRLCNDFNSRLYLYFLNSDSTIDFLMTNSRGVTMANLNKDIIERIPVPRIPLETQQQIITQIEQEQALVNANKQLITLFEQKIKDRIAKVWGTGKSQSVEYAEHDRITMATEE